MRPPRVCICPEGVGPIAFCAFSALVFAVLGWQAVAVVFWLLFAYCMWFFRDPERIVPQASNLAVSPADGRVIRIGHKPDPFGGQNLLCISIFMNLFSVHVNRSPVQGEVLEILYIPGSFFNAALDKAASGNERCALRLRAASGEEWRMVQIAGLVARRIVCRAREGDTLERGERFGLIRFGSRVDLYLPEGYAPAIKIGDCVYGGQSVLARKV